MNLLMDIPVNQEIRYTPSFLELAANFWIQYLALLIPSYFIIYELILGNAFRTRILDSRISSEIAHSQRDDGPNGKKKISQRYDF